MDNCKLGTEIDWQSACTDSTGGSTTPTTPSQFVPPTGADQIPVSGVDPTTGEIKYYPKYNPLTGITQADVGQALQVSSFTPNGSLILTTQQLVEKTPAIEAILGQIGTIDAFGYFNIINANTIAASGGNVIFAENNVSEIVNFATTEISIPGANTNTANRSLSYVIANKDKTFTVTETAPTPAQLASNLYIAEVLHPNGGPVKSVKPIATLQGSILHRIHSIADAIGLMANNFAFTYSTGLVTQTSTSAELIGYNIASGENILKVPSGGSITAEYYSYAASDRVASFSDFRKVYKIDNISTSSSATIPNGQFAIIIIGMYRTGEWIVFAPQKAFTTQADAEAGRTQYLSDFVMPNEYNRFVVKIASAIVPSTNAGIVADTLKVISNISLIGGTISSSSAATLPDPTSAPNGQIVTVNGSTHKYVLSNSPVPDLTNAPDGKILVIRNKQLVLEDPPATWAYPTGMSPNEKIYTMKITNGAKTNEYGDIGYITFDRTLFGDPTLIRTSFVNPAGVYLTKTSVAILDTTTNKYIMGGGVAVGGAPTPEIVVAGNLTGKTFQVTMYFQPL